MIRPPWSGLLACYAGVHAGILVNVGNDHNSPKPVRFVGAYPVQSNPPYPC